MLPPVASTLGRISGIVVDASGTPVAGATFTIDGVPITVGGPATRARPTGPVLFATGPDGAFTIGRAAGLHDVQIDVPGQSPTLIRGVEFVTGSTVDLGQVKIGAGEVKAGDVAASGGSWWKIGLGVLGGLAGVGLLSFVGWKLYKRRKGTAAPMSDYLCDQCRYVTPDFGP